MIPSNKNRENLAGALSLALGLTVAGLLKVSFLAPLTAPAVAKGTTLATPKAVRVTAKPKKSAVTPAPAKTAVATATPAKPRPAVREVPIQSSTAPTEPITPMTPPVIEVAPSLPLVQPALVQQPVQAAADMPLMPSTVPAPEALAPSQGERAVADVGLPMGRPDAPPDDYMPPPKVFAEQPGGDVMVLGLLLDSKGRPLDVQILVPSYNAQADTTYAMAVLTNQTFTDIDPPIPPGESRWIETRIYYPKRNILP
jgi:hypothetical protein